MIRTTRTILVVLLAVALTFGGSSGLLNDIGADGESKDPVPDDEPSNEEPPSAEEMKGDGEFEVSINVSDASSGQGLPGAEIDGWSEYTDTYEPQRVYGITDQNGSVSFRLDSGYFNFNVFKKGFFEEMFGLRVRDNMSHAVNLTAFPEQNSTVKGRLTDAKTGERLEGVEISFNLIESPYLSDEAPEAPPGEVPEEREEKEGEEVVEDSEEAKPGEPAPPEVRPHYYYPFMYNSTITSPSGIYSVSLIPGKYHVFVQMYPYFDLPPEPKEVPPGHHGEEPYEESGEGGARSTEKKEERAYYSLSTTVNAKANSTTWFNLTLKPLPPKNAAIRGFVTDENSAPLEGMIVNVVPDFPNEPPEIPDTEGDKDDAPYSGIDATFNTHYYPDYQRSHGRTDEKGYYEFSLRPGNYTLTVESPYPVGVEEGEEEWGGAERKEEAGTSGGGTGNEKDGRNGEDPTVTNADATPPGYFDERIHMFRFSVGNNETIWHNATLAGLPKKDATIVIEVRDKKTGKPVPNAQVDIYGGKIFTYLSEEVNDNGSLSADIFPGYYFVNVRVLHDRYMEPEEYERYKEEHDAAEGEGSPGGLYKVTTSYFPYSTEFSIGSGEVLSLDIALKPKPKDVVKLQGFVREASTDKPLPHFPLHSLLITEEHVLHNRTWTDETGHYIINLPLGNLMLTTGDETTNYPLLTRGDDEEKNEDRAYTPEKSRYYPEKYIVDLVSPGEMTKDFELEMLRIPLNDTLTVSIGGGSERTYPQLFVYDIDRGIDLPVFGLGGQGKVTDMEKGGGGRRGESVVMKAALPDGRYKAFAVGRDRGRIASISKIASFTITGGKTDPPDLMLQGTTKNKGELEIDISSDGTAGVASRVELGTESLMVKAFAENALGNGDMKITEAEKDRIEDYVTITGKPVIRPVLSIGGVPYVVETDTLEYRFGDDIVGEIDDSPLLIESSFLMEPGREAEIGEGDELSLRLKGPYSMEVECKVELPKELALEDGSRTVKKTMKIRATSEWREGLSDDFREKKEEYDIGGDAAAGAPSEDTDDRIFSPSDEDLGSDEGLQLTIFSAEDSRESASVIGGNMFTYLGIAILILVTFLVIFLVVKRKKK